MASYKSPALREITIQKCPQWGSWVVLSPRHTHGNGVGWELQRRGTFILMLDSGRKADSIGTHGRWREVPLV